MSLVLPPRPFQHPGKLVSMRFAIGVLALAACLTAQTAKATPGFTRAPQLEPAASYVAEKRVTVWCARTPASWRAFVVAHHVTGDEIHGLTAPGAATTHLDRAACAPLLAAARGEAVYSPTLAAVVSVLTHESIHMRGEVDEGVTECDAMHEMPGVAVRFFHVTPGKRLRALMADAWKGHATQTAAYRSVC